MKKYILISIALAFLQSNALYAAQTALPVPVTEGLLPTSVVRPLLEQDPEVLVAQAEREALKQEARLHDNSPHEWQAKLSSQRRQVESGQRYQEWNVGLERTLRLPGKASADRKIGQAMLEEGEARYGEALHETARSLLGLWLEWASSEQLAQLCKGQLNIVQEQLGMVEKRRKAGDAAKLDVNLASAELAEQQRLCNDVNTAVNIAWARLQARFPTFKREFASLPNIAPLPAEAAFWYERIASESDELKIAEALSNKASAMRARAQADKTPDPTLGIYTASEVGGRERITGVMLSIPLPGAQRDSRAIKAAHSASAAQHELELKKRQLQAEVGANIATAQGQYQGWQLADSVAASMQHNAQQIQRAYTLGEADLPTLLLARRQSATAAHAAVQAKSAAARSYYSLLVDAHLIWGLDHE
jgi:outer membrane protein TolC